MDESFKVEILDILQCHHMMTLATIRPDGYPQATTVNYVHEDLILFFATDAASRYSSGPSWIDVSFTGSVGDAVKMSGSFAATGVWTVGF